MYYKHRHPNKVDPFNDIYYDNYYEVHHELLRSSENIFASFFGGKKLQQFDIDLTRKFDLFWHDFGKNSTIWNSGIIK